LPQLQCHDGDVLSRSLHVRTAHLYIRVQRLPLCDAASQGPAFVEMGRDHLPEQGLCMRRDLMDNPNSNPNRRVIGDRRSGIDSRADTEKQLIGDRRSGVDRRSEKRAIQRSAGPSNEQLALFVRRVRRALGGQSGREFFGVTRGEYDFALYPDVLRTIEWLVVTLAPSVRWIGLAFQSSFAIGSGVICMFAQHALSLPCRCRA
jgi:hypothetical protein